VPAFISKIKTVAEFEPSEYGSYNENATRYKKGKKLAGIDFIFHNDGTLKKA